MKENNMVQNVQNVQNKGVLKGSSSANRETNLDTKTGKVSRGKHPNSLKNLNQFEKGVSGNPSGRPSKEDRLAKSLRKIGETAYPYGDYSYRIETLIKIWKKAVGGDWNCMKLLIDLDCLEKPNES